MLESLEDEKISYDHAIQINNSLYSILLDRDSISQKEITLLNIKVSAR